MLEILTIVGARPQFIKAAVISRLTASKRFPVNESILHTGQHYDTNMSDVFFSQLGIDEPYKNLGIGSGLHGETTGRMLEGIEREIRNERPDLVLVYGDTNSTLAGALAGAKLHVPVAHVEAGMRSFDRRMPEEVNRVLTDHVSDILFCPSESSANLLRKEGISEGVHVTGDIMLDAVKHYAAFTPPPPFASKRYALMTVHRVENVDSKDNLSNILSGVSKLPIDVVFPIHPRTKKKLDAYGLEVATNIQLIEPLSYLALLSAVRHCEFVLTDSGGLQKEAFYLGKKCVCMRETTEWTELVDIGANRLVGADPESITHSFDWASIDLDFNLQPYGSGEAGEKILELICRRFDK